MVASGVEATTSQSFVRMTRQLIAGVRRDRPIRRSARVSILIPASRPETSSRTGRGKHWRRSADAVETGLPHRCRKTLGDLAAPEVAGPRSGIPLGRVARRRRGVLLMRRPTEAGRRVTGATKVEVGRRVIGVTRTGATRRRRTRVEAKNVGGGAAVAPCQDLREARESPPPLGHGLRAAVRRASLYAAPVSGRVPAPVMPLVPTAKTTAWVPYTSPILITRRRQIRPSIRRKSLPFPGSALHLTLVRGIPTMSSRHIGLERRPWRCLRKLVRGIPRLFYKMRTRKLLRPVPDPQDRKQQRRLLQRVHHLLRKQHWHGG